MKVSEIIELPSLAFQLEGEANHALMEKTKKIVETATKKDPEENDFEKAQHRIGLQI